MANDPFNAQPIRLSDFSPRTPKQTGNGVYVNGVPNGANAFYPASGSPKGANAFYPANGIPNSSNSFYPTNGVPNGINTFQPTNEIPNGTNALPSTNGVPNGTNHFPSTNGVSNGASYLPSTNGVEPPNAYPVMADHGVETNVFNPRNMAEPSNPYPIMTDLNIAIPRLPKTNVLRERAIRITTVIQTRLGSSSGTVLGSISTIDDFLDGLAVERLRFMPHDGSNWDKVLRWAESFASYVYMFHEAVNDFMLHSEEATKMLWSSVLTLVQMGPRQINVLIKTLSIFQQLVFSITPFLRHRNLLTATGEIRRELAYLYSDLVELTCTVSAHYLTRSYGNARMGSDDFAEHFEGLIASFNVHKDRVSDAMWASNIGDYSVEESFEIGSIRAFLEPADRSVRTILASRASYGMLRAEFTCEWFNSPLIDFIRNNNRILLVTGGPGCGKSKLSGWIAEQLQSSMDHDPYDPVCYSVQTDIPATTSTLSLVKGLLLQAFDRHFGNEQLLDLIRQAIKLSSEGSSTAEVEKELWSALKYVAQHTKLMFVVDGLDQLTGGQDSALAVLDHLHQITAEGPAGCKAIVLSRPLQKAAPSLTQLLSVQEQDVFRDIRLFLTARLNMSDYFVSMDDRDKQTIAQKVAERSNGSFLWADFAVHCLRHGQTISSFLQSLDRAPKTVEAFFDYHISQMQLEKQEVNSVFSWTLTAERPLSLEEFKQMLEINVTQCSHSPRYGSISDLVWRACGPLVTVQDGFVCLRHPSIRQHLATFKKDKCEFDWRKAHSGIALRCLAYVKIHVYEELDVSFKRPALYRVYEVFDRYKFLEYCTRYWTIHFKYSTFYQANGEIQPSAVLKNCLSSSTTLALLEGACLHWQYTAKEAEAYSFIGYDLRRMIFGDRSAACLQSLFHVVCLFQAIRSPKTAEFAYMAWKISRNIGDMSNFAACADIFIASTGSITDTKRTEIIVRKEEVLKDIVSSHKHTHGASHDLTIRYTKMLVEMYASINEAEQAVNLCRELYEVSIERHGYFHKETDSLYELLVGKLKATSKFEVILEIAQSYHEHVVRTLDIGDARRFKSTMTLVQMYEERRESTKAEEILVGFWKSVTSNTATSTTIETRIDVAVEYSKFLSRQSRREEAEVIMRGLWTEVAIYQEETRSEALVERIRVIAEVFKTLEAFSMARSIIISLWSYYKNSEHSPSVAAEVATLLAETVTEITTKSAPEATTISAEILSIEEETILREVFESTLSVATVSSSVGISISHPAVKTCAALTAIYTKQERWSEAVEVYSMTLGRIWPSLESVEAVGLNIEHSEEALNIAMQLAGCHFKTLQIEKAEIVYRNIFRALVRSTCEIAILAKITKEIIEFHEKTYRFEKAISLYQEFSVHLQTRLGKTDALVVEVLAAYGTLARRLGRHKEAEEAYYNIYVSYRTEDGCCHADGVKFALTLCEMYEKQGIWDVARDVYASLWQTFVKHGAEYKLGATFVEGVYAKYMHILENRVKAPYPVVRQLAVDYRETCVGFYGMESELTVKATMNLAQICERDETDFERSVSLYEDVLKYSRAISSKTTTTTTTTERTIAITPMHTISQDVTTRLAQMYSSKNSTVPKAVTLYQEQFELMRQQHGHANKETLTVMRDLVLTYQRQNKQESTSKATTILRDTVLEIFKQESQSERLVESAQTIARIYIGCGLKGTATTLVQELRRTVIEEVRTTASVKTERTSYAFFAAFAEIIIGTMSFSAIMAEIRSEVILYESYFRVVKGATQIMTILERGARLRLFLLEAKRIEEANKIEGEIFDIFCKHINVSQNVEESAFRALFIICLECLAAGQSESAILERAVDTVLEYTNTARFQEAYFLGLLIHRYIQVQGGFHSQQYVFASFRLCLYLTGRRTKPSHDGELYVAMLELSRHILRESLEASLQLDVCFTEMDVDELNDIVILLGEQQNYEDLERILTDLWSSRTVQRTWSSTAVVSIGRRLIETRFSRGAHDSALHLCTDIRYNLTRVWGPLDATTLSFTVLLSELLSARQLYRTAMSLHHDVLAHLAYDDEHALLHACCDADGGPALLAVQHLGFLQRAYQRLGAWDRPAETYIALYAALVRRYGGDRAWQARAPQPLEAWAAKDEAQDLLGVWRKPVAFGFVAALGEGAAALLEKKKMGGAAGAAAVAGRRMNGLARLQRKVSEHPVMAAAAVAVAAKVLCD